MHQKETMFILSGITDVLDGYIARKYSMVTSWGKFADPLADKLTQVTALVILTMMQKIPWVVLVIVVLKESFMALGGFLIYRKKRFVVQSDWYGKMATVIFYVAVAAIIVFDINSMYNSIFIGVAVLSALFAFFMYLLTYIRINKISD
jgi:cardiolipin synthase